MINFVFDRVIDQIISSIRDRKDASILEQELYRYSSTLYDKLRLTKNIIFRNRPVDFSENYIPLNLISGEEIINSDNILNVLEGRKKIIIQGAAGSGKTTLLKHIAIDCYDKGVGYPIFLELRNFNEEKSNFEKFVKNSISENESISTLFDNGDFVFMFDGFDEINFVQGKDVIAQIDKFISKYNRNKFIFSSRPGTNIESLNHFYVYEIKPLSTEDIFLFVRKMELTNKVRNNIFDHLNSDQNFYKYLTNPLFLSLYINYIEYHSTNDVPSRKSVFFRNILDTLFSQHDSVSKLGFVRDKLSGLNRDQLEHVASILAFRAFISSKNSFSTDLLYNELNLIRRSTSYSFENENLIYDLTITVNILINDSGYYSFTHIVLLEFLSAIFISRLQKEKKENLYIKLSNSPKIFFSSTFLTFLFELDYRNFCIYFVIPFIDNHNSKASNLNENSHEEIIEFILTVFGTDSYYQYKSDYYLPNRLEEIKYSILDEIGSNDEENLDDLLQF